MEAIAALEAQMDGQKDTSVDVGTGGTSFADFDAMDEARDEYISAKTEDAVSRSKQVKEELGLKEAKGKDSPEEDEEESEDGEVSVGIQAEKAEIKFIKALDGDNPVSLNPDTKIPVTIDGETQEVSLAELRNNFSGKVAYDKRFTDIDREKKSLETYKIKVQRQEQVFNNVIDMIQNEEDPFKGLSYALDYAGVDSHNFYKKLQDKMLGDFDQISDMTEGERRAYLLEKENSFLRERNQTVLQKQSNERQRHELRNGLTHARTSRNLSEGDFVTGYNWLVQQGVQVQDITPDLIGERALDISALNKAESVLKTVDASLINDREALNATFKFIRENSLGENPTYTEEQVAAIVREGLGKKAANRAAGKQVLTGNKKKDNKTADEILGQQRGVLFADYEDD